jgi:tripartite-type tricarboxylate transporter receptor subunit TctC
MAAGLVSDRLARAQSTWPQKQVTIVIPFSAGGSADLIGRLVAQHLQTRFNVPFVIENRGGAGGSLAAAYVAKAKPDGYTLFVGTVSTNAINPYLYEKLSFDVERDFAPISLLVSLPNILVVSPTIPARTVTELVDYLKANEGMVSYGSSGNGTSSHLCAVMFQMATGTKMIHVPFRSTSEELNNLIGGHIQLAFDSMTTSWPHVVSGAIRAIAVSTPKRSPAAPEVPAVGETIKGFEATGWQGLFAPGGTPPEIVAAMSAEVKQILSQPEVVESLRKVGGEPMPMSPGEFLAFNRAERAKWSEVVKNAGIKIE